MKISRTCKSIVPCVTALALAWCLAMPEPAVAAESGRDLLLSLTRANDEFVRVLVEGSGEMAPGRARAAGLFGGARGTGAQFMVLAAAYSNRDSQFHHEGRLLPLMERLTKTLRESQFEDGLWGESGNIDSPPDSSFVLKTLCKGQLFLQRDGSRETLAVRQRMQEVILSCAEGVRTGGVHTPNHRWAVASALAFVNELFPDPKWIARIDDWLGEGIDVDADGQWAERSPNYSSDVNNPAMMEMALLLKRPALFEGVRRNLEMTRFHVAPNGEVEIVASRRQDQRGTRKYIHEYYVPYRGLAILEGNPGFAGMARWIERDFLGEIARNSTNMSSALTTLLLFPELARDLPAAEEPPADYEKVFPGTAMARIRRQSTTATIYGGSDWYAGLGSGSGIATNPTFFRMYKGEAVLEGIRMTPAYFSTGFFYSQGLRAEGGGYVLSQTLNVPYHLPLPAEHRNQGGSYRLSPDMGTAGILGRYFSKMDFANRPSQFRTLETRITITEAEGGYDLEFDIEQLNRVPVAVTLELAFRRGGTFKGVVPLPDPAETARALGFAPPSRGGPLVADDSSQGFLLREGYGTYTMGSDTITFGPGGYFRPPGRMESEMISWVNGHMRAEGDRVYITGVTPFKYRLTIR